MNLNELRDEAYQIAKEHGWHEKEYSNKHYLMLIISEIAEAVQADRKDKHADVAKFKEWRENILQLSEKTRMLRFSETFEAYIKNTVEDKLADVVIRCLDLAGLRGYDLEGSKILIKLIKPLEGGIEFIELCYQLSLISTCNDITERKVIYIIAAVLHYCELTGIDIEWFIEQKMKYNLLCPFVHGDKRY